MKQQIIRTFFMTIAILALLVGGRDTSPAAAQTGEEITIFSPQSGDTVADVIKITGTVDFADFQKFEVFLNGGGNMIWVATIFSPVISSNLAQLDTRTVEDGGYQLVIRTVHKDSNYTDHPGPSITIKNDLGAPQPFSEVTSSYLYPSPNGAVARVQNCSGYNLFFDYTSPKGFCSAAEIVVPPKLEGNNLCPSTDVFLTACEYHGTAFVEEPNATPYNYSFTAETGKVYEIIHPGGAKLYINQVKGDEMEPVAANAVVTEAAAETSMAAKGDSMGQNAGAPPAVASSGQPEEAPSMVTELTDEMATQMSAPDEMLPESGQSAASSRLPFILAGGTIILFMVLGGVIAVQRNKQIA